jgi:hypothetical protein
MPISLTAEDWLPNFCTWTRPHVVPTPPIAQERVQSP